MQLLVIQHDHVVPARPRGRAVRRARLRHAPCISWSPEPSFAQPRRRHRRSRTSPVRRRGADGRALVDVRPGPDRLLGAARDGAAAPGRRRPACRCSGSASAGSCSRPSSVARVIALRRAGDRLVRRRDRRRVDGPAGPVVPVALRPLGAPARAREVARNAAASQAFVLRRNLAVQFHPELTSSMLAGWLGNGGAGKAAAAGLDPDTLARRHARHRGRGPGAVASPGRRLPRPRREPPRRRGLLSQISQNPATRREVHHGQVRDQPARSARSDR